MVCCIDQAFLNVQSPLVLGDECSLHCCEKGIIIDTSEWKIMNPTLDFSPQ
jgi:hypothetical protein